MNKVYRKDNYELKQVSSYGLWGNHYKWALNQYFDDSISIQLIVSLSILELLDVYNCIFMSWSINQFMFLPHAGKRWGNQNFETILLAHYQ